MANIVIVCGAPGSGKTTYVKSQMTDKDIAWDMDYIKRALCLQDDLQHDIPIVTLNAARFLRIGFLAYIKKYRTRYDAVYVITSASISDAKDMADECDGRLYVMPTSFEDCVKNIANDETRKNTGEQIELAKKWYGRK